MKKLLIAGAGQIGTTISHLLATTGQYHCILADFDTQHVPDHIKELNHVSLAEINVKDHASVAKVIKENKVDAVISCLPYFCNPDIAQMAFNENIHYFDLTEDIEVAAFVTELAKNTRKAFVPRCGLAPGFINIIANNLMQQFDELDSVKLRCGGLPIDSSNELKYAFTWSVDGLINEYNKPCHAIENGKLLGTTPLGGLEAIQIDGLNYEAFNTSGGIGSLTESYKDKVQSLNYKTIRYPGHRDRMHFLLRDLKLSQDTDTLKKILLNAIPFTHNDVVIIFVSVSGKKSSKLMRESFVRKYYHMKINDTTYSALALTTAASACTAIDTILENPNDYHGRILQEQFQLDHFLHGKFGKYLNGESKIDH